MTPQRKLTLLKLPLLLSLMAGAGHLWAAPLLATELASFSVLSGTPGATNTGTTTLYGNLGVNPALSTTGSSTIVFTHPGAGIITGPLSTAALAQTQLAGAITNVGLMTPAIALANTDLTGTLNPGIYSVGASATNLSGALVLDGQGNANASWVFLMSSTLITSSGSMVSLINTGPGASVFWQVTSSATLGTNSSFEGNILAHTTITMNTGASIGCGRALSNIGYITMDSNSVGLGCTGMLSGSDQLGGATRPQVSAVPEPETLAMLLSGLGLVGFAARRKISKSM